jgi:spore coat-associated protein N
VAGVSHRRSLTAKLFASIGVVGAAASCAGLSTYADPASARAAVAISAARPRLVVLGRVLDPAKSVAPGDRVNRALTLTARGRGFRRLVLTVKTKKASRLTGRDGGLRLTIRRCTKRWARSQSGYACPGRTSTVLKTVPVVGRRRLAHGAVRRGKKLFLLVTLVLPSAAGNEFQNQTSTLVYRFTGS